MSGIVFVMFMYGNDFKVINVNSIQSNAVYVTKYVAVCSYRREAF